MPGLRRRTDVWHQPYLLYAQHVCVARQGVRRVVRRLHHGEDYVWPLSEPASMPGGRFVLLAQPQLRRPQR
jgi:hypothetical protein